MLANPSCQSIDVLALYLPQKEADFRFVSHHPLYISVEISVEPIAENDSACYICALNVHRTSLSQQMGSSVMTNADSSHSRRNLPRFAMHLRLVLNPRVRTF